MCPPTVEELEQARRDLEDETPNLRRMHGDKTLDEWLANTFLLDLLAARVVQNRREVAA